MSAPTNILTPLQGALDWASRGFHVFALHPQSKKPIHEGWPSLATIDAAQINKWAAENENCNFGCAPALSGHVVFDLDQKNGKDGVAELKRVAAEHGFDVPDTLIVATPNGGFHLYFNGTAQSSAGRIAPGVDVRSRGGYVVLPGSIVDGKAYTITNDVEAWGLPDAPAKLLRLAEGKKREAVAAPPGVIFDSDSNKSRAIDYLKRAEPAIEGSGGDTHTYELAADLHDLGISEDLALKLMEQHYNGRCVPPWSRDELAAKIANAYQYAQNEAGCHAVAPASECITPEDLANLMAASVASREELPLDETSTCWLFGTHDPVADAAAPPITYRDALKLWPDSQGKTVSQVIAGPKQHKTNWIMAELFRLMQSASAKVLMLALEGGYGVRTMRLKALAAYYKVPLSDLRGRFQIVEIKSGGIFDMSNPDCVAAFADFVMAGGWTDVFVDTQHRAAGALEENSATDARLFWNAVEVLRRRGNVNVVLAHHTGKDETKGGRGSSADLASVDQQIELKFDRLNMTVIAKVTARKDGVDGFSAPFKVEQASENSVPILVPMASEEFQALNASQDRTAAQGIAAALQAMEAIGRAKACTTPVIAHQILLQRDELPRGSEECERAVANLVKRIQERAPKDARLQAYGRKDGSHKTAPWIWYLPDEGREAWSNV